jgi:WXG100 family type VII secretion target
MPFSSLVVVAGMSQLRMTRERKPAMASINLTYADMQSAAQQLQSGEAQIQADLSRLNSLIQSLVTDGYVTQTSSKQYEAAYTQFNQGATQTIDGLNGLSQFLQAAINAFTDTDTGLASSIQGQ